MSKTDLVTIMRPIGDAYYTEQIQDVYALDPKPVKAVSLVKMYEGTWLFVAYNGSERRREGRIC